MYTMGGGGWMGSKGEGRVQLQLMRYMGGGIAVA